MRSPVAHRSGEAVDPEALEPSPGVATAPVAPRPSVLGAGEDGQTFVGVPVDGGELAAGRDALAVTVEATADDLITARLAPNAARRKAAIRRIRFDGAGDAVAELQQAFQLSA